VAELADNGLAQAQQAQEQDEVAIAVRGLRKSFGPKQAVAGIDLDTPGGRWPAWSGRTARARPPPCP
jgi:hypothetical protein